MFVTAGVIALSLAITLGQHTVAEANEIDEALAAIQGVSLNADEPEEALLDDSASFRQVGEARVAASGAAIVTVPTDATEGITLEGAEYDLRLQIPYAAEAQGSELITKGIPAYNNQNSSVTIRIAKIDGTVQVSTVLLDSRAPSSYEYSISGDATTIQANSDGSLTLLDQQNTAIAFVAPAWAVDAAGVSLQTSYTVKNNSFTQQVVVTESTEFPVVADPWIGYDLIKYFTWYSAERSPAISIAVTPMMATLSSVNASHFGWEELKTKVRASNQARYNYLVTRKTLKDQWKCHAFGKAAIGVAGWLGIDKRPTWDLEGFRRPVGQPGDYVREHCNW